MLQAVSKTFFSLLAGSQSLKTIASRYGLRAPGGFARRFIAGETVEAAAEPLETRGIVVAERGRFRVRDRSVLRYYARTIQHLLVPPRTVRTH